MVYNVCLFCGRGRCKCPTMNAKNWRAPIVSVSQAMKQHVSPDDVIVMAAQNDGLKDFMEDPDWDLSLEAYS